MSAPFAMIKAQRRRVPVRAGVVSSIFDEALGLMVAAMKLETDAERCAALRAIELALREELEEPATENNFPPTNGG